VFLMNNYDAEEMVNIGVGTDQTIAQLARLVKETVGFNGAIKWDITKPDGMEQKLLDVSKLKALGFTAKADLQTGIKKTYEWYLTNA